MTPKSIKSFSQAATLLEERGIPVTSAGRQSATGALAWRVGDELLTKEQVVRHAQQLAANTAARVEPAHTAEPWAWTSENYRDLSSATDSVFAITGTGGTTLAVIHETHQPAALANAARIVACVNATVGISTAALESNALTRLFRAVADILVAGEVDAGRAFVCSLDDIEALAAAARELELAQVPA